MLKLLIRKQLQEVFSRFLRRGNRNGKKRSGKGMAILLIFLMLYLVGIFAWVAWLFSELLFETEMGWLFYLLQGGAAVLFGTFGSVFSTYYTLYLAKDNDLLLSMPIPIRDVIASRLLGVYVMGLVYSGMISLPAAVIGLIRGGVSFSALAGNLVFVLLVSLIVLILSCLLGWVVAKLSLRLKNKSWATVLISLGFLAVYYVVYFRVMNHVPELLEAAIRVGGKIKNSAWPIYLFGRIGEGDWLGMLVWTLGTLFLMALVWFAMKRSFLATATASAGTKKAAHREKTERQGSVSAALFRREWLRFSSSANYMLNCGLGLLMLLGLGVYLIIQGKTLLGYMSLLPRFFEDALPVLLTAACCLMAGMVDVSAPSVSLEGKTLWQIQCLPVAPWQVLRAKLELHLALAAFPVLFCTAVLMALVPATLAQKLLMLAVTVLAGLFIALLGLFLGLKMPNLDWTNEVVPIKQSAAVLITIFSGIGLAGLIAGLYLLFGYHLGTTAWLGAVSLLLLAANAALFLWLRHSGSRRFAELN